MSAIHMFHPVDAGIVLGVAVVLLASSGGTLWGLGDANRAGLAAGLFCLASAAGTGVAARGDGAAFRAAAVGLAGLTCTGVAVCAAAIAAAACDRAATAPSVLDALAATVIWAVGALLGVALHARRRLVAPPALAGVHREVAGTCGVCRNQVAADDLGALRCPGRRADGRRCVAVYHRDHLDWLHDRRCEYCNTAFAVEERP